MEKPQKNPQTIALKTMLRTYSRFFIHGTRVYNAPNYSDPFTFILTGDHYQSNGLKSTLELTGNVHGGHTDAFEEHKGYDGHSFYKETEAFRPKEGFWSLLAGEEYLRSAVESLPDDATIELEVYLDAGSNQILLLAKLHADKLILKARWKRGKKEICRSFIIDTYNGRHNTARFGEPKSTEF